MSSNCFFFSTNGPKHSKCLCEESLKQLTLEQWNLYRKINHFPLKFQSALNSEMHAAQRRFGCIKKTTLKDHIHIHIHAVIKKIKTYIFYCKPPGVFIEHVS